VTSPGALGKRRITADIVVQIVGRLLNLLLGVFVTVAIVRHLGSAQFGKWATILAVINLVATMAPSAMGRVIVPRAAAEPDRERQWLGAMIELQALLAIPAAVIALVVLAAISRGSDMRVAGLIATLTVGAGVLAAYGLIWQLRVRNDLSVAMLTLNSVLWAGGVLAVILTGSGLVALSIAFTASMTITSAVTALLARGTVKYDYAGGRELWREIIRVSVPVAIFGVSVTAYNQVDQLIVFGIAGSKDAGLYGAVYRILDQAGVFPAAVLTTLTPIFASTHRMDLPRVRRLLQAAADNLGILSFGAVALAAAAGGPILELLYGSDFRSAGAALVLLMLAYVVISLGYVFGSMVVVLGVQRRLLRYSLLALGVNVGLNLILVSLFGYVAAAAVTVVTELLILVLTMRLVSPLIDFRLHFSRMLRAALAAGVMCGLVLLLRYEANVPLGWLIAVALVSYLALLLLLQALRPGELISLVTQKA
jgi:O-antigen/teichoic acid export membrane protein